MDDTTSLLHCVQQHIEQPVSIAPVTQFSLHDMCQNTLALYAEVLK